MPLRKKFHLTAAQLGKGCPLFCLRSDGQGLVVVGASGKGAILSHDGKINYHFSLQAVTAVSWDCNNECVAFLTSNGQVVSTYNTLQKKTGTLDVGLKELCFMKWSPVGPHIAVGNVKGGLTIFNKDTLTKIPVLGVHSGRIIDGEWLMSNALVTVGEDCLLTMCSHDGTLICQVNLSSEPLSLTTIEPSRKSPPASPTALVLVLMKRSLAVLVPTKTDKLHAFEFSSQAGNATCLSGLNSATCVACVGFSTGFVVLYSLETHQGSRNPIGKELCVVRPFASVVKSVAMSDACNRCAVVGDNQMRVFDMMDDKLIDPPAELVNLPIPYGETNRVAWDRGGNSITISGLSGDLLAFSTSVLLVSCAAKGGALYLTGQRDIAFFAAQTNDIVLRVTAPFEPTFLAAGQGRIAAGTGRIVCYYAYRGAETGGAESTRSQGAQLKHSMSNVDMVNSGGASTPSAHAETPATAAQSPNSSTTKGAPGPGPSGGVGGGGVALGEQAATLLTQVEYEANVQALKVNGTYAAVVFGGQIHVHPIGSGNGGGENQAHVLFPAQADPTIHSVHLSDHFLTYATKTKICVVVLDGMQTVVEYTVPKGVKQAYPSPIATRIAFIDNEDVFYVFNPVTETVTQVEGYEPNAKLALWDENDYTVLVTITGNLASTFSYVANSRHGATCESVLQQGNTKLNLHTPIPAGFAPVSVYGGNILCQMPSGSITCVPLRSHQDIYSPTPSMPGFYNSFSLNHLRVAVQHMTSQKQANDLCIRALHLLDIDLALRVYCQMSEPGVVMCLEKIKHIHEKNLLIGHVCMILRFFKDAENAFLRSSQPIRALEMRRDLMQWEHALALARNLAPDQLPLLSKDYAQQLEYRGDYAKALQMYKAGIMPVPPETSSTLKRHRAEAQNKLCGAGVARCLLRTGGVKEGVQWALASGDQVLQAECAKILENQRQFEEAGQLYESSGNVEKAATLFIVECRNLKAAGRLIPVIKSRNILSLYAKGKEAEKAYEEAEEAFRLAEDWDNVVRVKAEFLNDLHGAYVIVRKTRSAESAALVARMCRKKGENGAAVEFLVLAKQVDEAFRIARQTGTMASLEGALLGQVVLKDGVAPPESQADFLLVAEHYDSLGKAGLAGQFYHIAGDYNMALRKYLEAGQPEDIEKAVQVVGKARSDALTNRLIDYLIGEGDGEPKDTSYIFKLYMALGSYEKAAKTSVLIASKEQEIGNYRVAHRTLVEACRMLQSKGMHIPSDLRRALMLLHSYTIVKHLTKAMNDDATATRMLLRVVRNIRKFPQHIPTILTSTVLQCLKAGFHKSAFENARLIIQAEKYRTDLTEKQRKRIEGVVRHRGNEELLDPPEPKTPCPECGAPVPETELDCGACKNSLPFCIVTGKHMVKTDYSYCPHCKFPALYSAFTKYLIENPRCPLCDEPVNPNEVSPVADGQWKQQPPAPPPPQL